MRFLPHCSWGGLQEARDRERRRGRRSGEARWRALLNEMDMYDIHIRVGINYGPAE